MRGDFAHVFFVVSMLAATQVRSLKIRFVVVMLGVSSLRQCRTQMVILKDNNWVVKFLFFVAFEG